MLLRTGMSARRPVAASPRCAVALEKTCIARLTFDETITYATDGIEIFSGCAELFTKAAHMGINGARIDHAVVLPDIAQQLLAGLNPAAALGQHAQQLELGSGQCDLFAAPAHQVAGSVNAPDRQT